MRTTETPRTRWRSLVGAVALSLIATGLAPAAASAQPPPHDGKVERDAHDRHDKHDRKGHERREALMRRIRVVKAVELGEALELDSEAMVRLTQTLAPFDEEREKLRLENLELTRALKKVAKGEATGDAAAPAKRLASNRVRLAELDRRELEAVIEGLPPEKAARATLFLAEFPRRMERLADEVKRGKHHPRRDDDRPGRRGHRKHHGERPAENAG